MKLMPKLYGFAGVAVLSAIVLYACSKDDKVSDNEPLPEGKQQVSLYLTDDPGFFDNVFVDIRSVKVLLDTCARQNDDDDDDDDDNNGKRCAEWQTLDIKPGVYDLLSLRNGTDTLLANGIIPGGKVYKIKIELGNNNSLVKDSVTYPLNIFPGIGSTVIISVKGGDWEEFLPDRFRLWLDFDVARSVIRVRDGEFYLKPVIHLFAVKATGGVAGVVLPKEAYPVISVYNGQDTAYALPFHHGAWKVRGLKAGTYNVYVNASNGYQDTTITNVSVKIAGETKLPTITLHK